jgi:serine/threonine protein kinase
METSTINFANLQGYTVGRYRLQNLLGHGAMGNVYKSRHPELKRDIAIKILHPYHTQVPGFVERFRHEAAAAAALIHPNIIQITDFDVSNSGLYFMVMQYINGPSLEEYLSLEQYPLSLLKTYQLITPIVAALHYAHNQGIIHRDVKPGNIMLDTRERGYLGDFGMAKIVGVSMHTQSGLGVGTPAYMAPEQMETTAITPTADIYALGVLLYRMLTATLPFEGESLVSLIRRKTSELPPPPRSVNSDIPEDVEALILKAMATDPEARYEDAASFAAALQEVWANHVPDLPKFDMDTAVSSGVVALPSVHIDNYRIQREFASDQSRLYQRYLARNEALESTAVLTVLKKPAASDPTLTERFQERLEKLALCDHPGLATITRIGETEEARPFVAYEYVPGQSLANRLRQEWSKPAKCLPITASLALVRAIAEALDVVHQAGLLHNELTPEHIIIRADNQPVLVGLEIPKPPAVDPKTINPNTPGYIPPELYAGKPLSVPSNIYSLGIILYELLSGHPPSMPLWNLAHYAPADVPPAIPLVRHRSQLAPETNLLLGKCLATYETDRFQNVAAFLAQLDIASEVEKDYREPLPPLIVSPPIPPERYERDVTGWWQWRNGAIAALILLLLLLAGFIVRQQLLAAPTDLATVTPTAVSPTPSPTATDTAVPQIVLPASPTTTPTQTATATASPTRTPTFTRTPTHTASPTLQATASPTATACPRPPGWVRYIVQAGDTLQTLAETTGSTADEIREANCLRRATLFVGQRLWLPQLPVTATPTATIETPSPTPTDLPTEPPPTNRPPTATPTDPPTVTPTDEPSATPTSLPTPSRTPPPGP